MMQSTNIQSLPDHNPRYHYTSPNTKLVLSTTPETVSYNVAAGTGLSEQNLFFTLEPEGNFLDRGIVLKMPNIPLKFTRVGAIGGAAGSKTLADFFGGYELICMRQFGILNAIENVKVTIDGKLHYSNSNLGKTLNIVAQTYDKALVHAWFQASQPDLYATYAQYAAAGPTMNVVAEDGSKFDIRKPTLATMTIFNELSDDYSSRIPFFSAFSTNLTEVSTIAYASLIDQKCFIPFNIFGISTDESPIYNAKKISVSIQLRASWWKHIFSLRSVGGPNDMINNIEFDRTRLQNFVPKISYIVRTGTNDSLERANQFYAKRIPIVETSSTIKEFTVASQTQQKVDRQKFDIHTIPKKLFLYAKAKWALSDAADLLADAKTADLFGRWDTLQITMGNKTTNIAANEASVLYDLSKANGLNRPYEQAMYFNGAVVAIDISESIGLEPGTFIGTPGTRNGGSPGLYIAGAFTNLASVDMVYEIGIVVVYDGVLTQDAGAWSILTSFTPPEYSGTLGDIEEDIMNNINVIGGRADILGGNAFTSFFAKYLPKIGVGLKNLVSAAFTNKNGFRDNVVKTWNGGATFDNHSPFNGGFTQHSNRNNERGGAYTQQWSTSP